MNISIVDIKRAIISKLKENYPSHTVYGEKMPSEFKRPSFYIYFVPLETGHNSRFFIEKAVIIKVDYYPENRTQEENWVMADELECLFHNDLPVKGRYLTVNRTNSESIEDVLTFTLTVDYENGIEMIAIENEDGKIEYEECDERLGYTQGKIKLMQDLELK